MSNISPYYDPDRFYSTNYILIDYKNGNGDLSYVWDGVDKLEYIVISNDSTTSSLRLVIGDLDMEFLPNETFETKVKPFSTFQIYASGNYRIWLKCK